MRLASPGARWFIRSPRVASLRSKALRTRRARSMWSRITGGNTVSIRWPRVSASVRCAFSRKFRLADTMRSWASIRNTEEGMASSSMAYSFS